MNILNWLSEYWFVVVIFVCVLFVLVVHIIKLFIMKPEKRLSFIKNTIFSLVLKAEEQLGSKTGELKLKLVINTFYKKYPIAKLIISETKLIEVIEESVAEMKDILKKNSI